MRVDLRFWFWFVLSAFLFSQCTPTHAKTPEPYGSQIKQLQQQAKQDAKAANKAVAAERKARAKACDKEYAARGAQLDVAGRVGCM